nr:peptidase [Nitrosopumilus sp.]
MKNLLLLSVLIFTSLFVFDSVYGHGVGSEIFPPVELDDRLVSLEVSSSTNDSSTNDNQQISISLIDFDSKITLRDVTFLIKSERGDQFLFEKEFKADNGFLVFNFVSEDTDSIIVSEKDNDDLFGSLLGLESRLIDVKGPKLSEGGLY